MNELQQKVDRVCTEIEAVLQHLLVQKKALESPRTLQVRLRSGHHEPDYWALEYADTHKPCAKMERRNDRTKGEIIVEFERRGYQNVRAD